MATEELTLAILPRRVANEASEFERIMMLPERTYREFKTYKKTFERLCPFFWVMYKLDRVPKSFYMKFALPTPRIPVAQTASAKHDLVERAVSRE